MTFCKEKRHSIVRNSLIYTNSVLILATIRLLISERAGLLEQKIDPQVVTSGNSNFAR